MMTTTFISKERPVLLVPSTPLLSLAFKLTNSKIQDRNRLLEVAKEVRRNNLANKTGIQD